MEVTSALYDIFTCPSCRNIMTPPIFMCDIGHSLCQNCYYNVEKCPTCRAAISARRNTAVERIQSNFVFPCSNQDDGCKFNGSAMCVREHEVFCVYSLVQCELKIDDCKWTGIRENLLNHCLEHHPNNVTSASQQIFLWPKVENDSCCRILINAFEKQFLCLWFFENAYHANFSVTYLGSMAEANNYYYTIEFGTGDDLPSTRLFKRKCHSAKACKMPRSDLHVFTKLKNVVRDFANRDQFYYTVTIYNYNVSYVQIEEEKRKRNVNLESALCPKWRPAKSSDVETVLY
ncbi:hypothetical protein RN001_008115 [Aquatica leii]|uniref:RING-type E3 ubiquitin transferase n=1 Tax=Aquatica leii TaxID=1421715 RepID=A0AAN7P9W5_9COLE|nr:hypothetical protein RN001_008115 [Aquatica leii]